MTRMLSLLLAGLLLPAVAQAGESKDSELPGVGAEAPSFVLPVYNPDAAGASRAGTMLLVGEDTEDPGVKLIVVSFMASFCKPCKKELPLLQKLHTKYKADGLRIIGVSIDKDAAGQEAMQKLIAQHKVTFPVTKDQLNLTALRYLGSKSPLPSLFVMDKNGTVTYVSRGYAAKDSAKITDLVEKALKEAK